MFGKNLQAGSTITRSVGKPISIGPPVAGFDAAKPGAKPQVAIFIAHGMGQQVPFETLDSVAEGLAKAAERKSGAPVSAIRARTVQIGELKTQRAEFDMRDAHGADVEVHVYEAYWAPFTEGEVNLRDVMSFLLRAGLNGLRNFFDGKFYRWLFGRGVAFDKQRKAGIALFVTLLAVLSLVTLNSVIALAAADRIFNPILQDVAPRIDQARFNALTAIAGSYLVIAAVTGLILGLLYGLKKRVTSPATSKPWRFATAVAELLVYVWVAATIAAAVIALVLLLSDWIALERFQYEWLRFVWMLIWGLLLAASWFIRSALVQYMGDVAAYVSAHWLDRFNDLRKKIKEAAIKQAQAIYSVPDYQRIAMVGHSLGSVITYDTLNALINEDVIGKAKDLAGKPLNVVGRTKLLLTFGSPLDKTAFIFATQWANTTATREALAASLQPLISDYLPYRNIKWINVHAPRDIVCAHLDFYDDSSNSNAKGRTVENVTDPDALIPLVAHIEYWQNETLFDELYGNL